LEKCTDWLQKEGISKFKEFAERVSEIKKFAVESGLKIPENCDRTRITFDFSRLDSKEQKFSDHLRFHKVEPELVKNGRVVLIPSPFNSEKDFLRLKNAILSFYITF
jgi:hypothetical protein